MSKTKRFVGVALAVGALAGIGAGSASAAPTKPVGSQKAVINQVCNHYNAYLQGFYNQAVFWKSVGNEANYNTAVTYLVWTMVVHGLYCK